MSTSKDFFSKISNYLHAQITMYRFNKNAVKVTDKYRRGRLAALKYASELSIHYIQIEKTLTQQFKDKIDCQMKSHACLQDGDFKQGLYDGLNDVLDAYRENSTPS